MKIIPLLIFALITSDQEVISQTNCMILGGKGIEDAKSELLLAARRGAVEQLFGSLVASLSQVEDLVLKQDQIRTASLGYVRLVGSPLYFNGESLGEICVRVQAYTTEEDRAKLRPKELSKKACVAEGDVGTIRKRAEEKAIYEALTDYDAALKRIPPPRILPLLHEVRFSEGDFVKDALTYCVRATGALYPIEAAALATHGQSEKENLLPDVPALPSMDLTGSWEFVVNARRAWNQDGSIYDVNYSVNLVIDLKQHDHRVSGKIVGTTSNACRQATLSGLIDKDDKIQWSLIYTGNCCQGSEMLFSGTVNQNSGDSVIRGKLEPKGKPPVGPCELWWADVVGSKRL